MFNSVLALAALAMPAPAANAHRFVDDLIITKVSINLPGGSDDNQGGEFVEIRNIGATSVNLGTNKVAILAIENEAGQHGEFDWGIALTGTLDPGERMIVRDSTGTSSNTNAVSTKFNGGSFETTNANDIQSIIEFMPGSTGTDMSNSGDCYLLVSGYEPSRVTIGQELDNGSLTGSTANDLVFDFMQDSVGSSNDVWTGVVYDAFVIAPDSHDYPAGLDDYSTNLSTNHKVVGVVNNSWTADYAIRLKNNSTGDYDQAFQFDLVNNPYEADGSQRGMMSGDSYTDAGATAGHYYALALAGGNFTDQSGWTGFTINGDLYVTA